MSERTLDLISKNDVRWVDLRFTDTKGKEQHVSIPATAVDEDFLKAAKCLTGRRFPVGKVSMNQT